MFHGLLRVGKITQGPHNLKSDSLQTLVRDFTDVPLMEHTIVLTIDFGMTKTDQTGEHHQWTWVAKENTLEICPVHCILRYVGQRPESSCLFCDQAGLPIKRGFFTHILTQAFQEVIGPTKAYHSHSLRMRGGGIPSHIRLETGSDHGLREMGFIIHSCQLL